MINPWVILGFVLAIGAAAGGGYYTGKGDGKAEIKQEWDAAAREQAEKHAEELAKVLDKQQSMQDMANKLQREKDAEIRNINARATALANSLRDRPERPSQTSSVSDSPRSCSGASGAELARGDGEFLAGYSSDAAKLDAALDKCIAQYEAVKRKLKE